jgi:hypothetical protein
VSALFIFWNILLLAWSGASIIILAIVQGARIDRGFWYRIGRRGSLRLIAESTKRLLHRISAEWSILRLAVSWIRGIW